MYAVAIVAMVGVAGWLLTLGFRGPRDASAIRLSAVVVVAVQLIGFVSIKLVGSQQVIVGWGIAALLRFLTMIVYAVLVAKVWPMPLLPALISMATFFFFSTLIEPLLLRL